MLRQLLAFIAFVVIRLWCLTLRYRFIDGHHSLLKIQDGYSVLYAFWHGKQLMLFGYPGPRPMVQMVSLSKDGDLQKAILGWFGFSVVRGSPKKRGEQALYEMTEQVLQGYHGALAVDGSRGPVHQVKPGIVHVARDTGAVIIPIAAAARYRTVLKSTWDQYEIPWLFSPTVIVEGQPIEVDQEIDDDELERIRKQLELRLRMLHLKAEEMVRPAKQPPADDEENEDATVDDESEDYRSDRAEKDIRP